MEKNRKKKKGRYMRKIECKEHGGKVHIINYTLTDGTNMLNCGLAQQKPHHISSKRKVCYGKWELTKNRVTCKRCKRY